MQSFGCLLHFTVKKFFERNKYIVLWPKKLPQSSNSLINVKKSMEELGGLVDNGSQTQVIESH